MVDITLKRKDLKDQGVFDRILSLFHVPYDEWKHIDSFEVYSHHLQALNKNGEAEGWYWVEEG